MGKCGGRGGCVGKDVDKGMGKGIGKGFVGGVDVGVGEARARDWVRTLVRVRVWASREGTGTGDKVPGQHGVVVIMEEWCLWLAWSWWTWA